MRTLVFLLVVLLGSPALCQNWTKINKESLVYYNTGQYEAAKPAMELALDIAEKKYGLESTEYITSLNNYTFLQKAMGMLPDAVLGFHEIGLLSQKVYGEESIEYIEVLNQKAILLLSMAVYDSCEFNLNASYDLIITQAETQSKYYSQNILRFFNALIRNQTTLASLYYNRGQLEKAITTLEEQVNSMKDAYGEYIQTDNNYNVLLSNLSTYYLDDGRVQDAKELVFQSIELEKSNNGSSSIQYLNLRNNLASIYRSEYYLDSAFYIWQQTEFELANNDLVGSEIHLTILTNLGELMIEEENYLKAVSYLLRSKRLHEQRGGLIPNLYQVTLYRLADAYHWQGYYQEADLIYQQLMDLLINSIIHEFTYLNETEKRSFYENQLLYIDSYLEFAFEISNLLPLQESENPYINPNLGAQLYDLQLMTKATIISSSGKVKERILQSNDESLKRDYTDWEVQKNYLSTLYNTSDVDPVDLKILVDKIEQLEANLNRSSAIFKGGFTVDQVGWQDIQAELKTEEAAVELIRILDGLAYLAVIITPDIKTPVLSMAISTRSKKLDEEFYSYYKNAIRYKLEDTLSYQTYWRAIRDTIIAHSADHRMPKKVYLSADGIYSQINLNTLFNKETNTYIIDETEIHLLTNTKELLDYSATTKTIESNTSAVLFGDPLYSINQEEKEGYFTPLPETKKEIDLINSHLIENGWKTKVFQGPSATVSNLKENSSASILNLSTHGFFNRAGSDNFYEILLSSGLAFAGANTNISYFGEDGVLTAYEAVNLELESTELVVLSACESGLGKYQSGAGVYGLQRAIKVAGTESILMSLWKVDDKATQELMVNFYRNWIPNNDKRSAFRSAQQELRKIFPEPYYWGAFIMVGK